MNTAINSAGITPDHPTYFGLMFGGEKGRKQFIELAIEEMEKAVKEDGAEAILVTCAISAAVLTMHGVQDIDGARVINSVTAAIKLAEILVDWRQSQGMSVSKRSIYAPLLSDPGKEKPPGRRGAGPAMAVNPENNLTASSKDQSPN